MRKSGGKAVRYNKWGYIFLIPFIVVYVVFQLVPLITTIYNSFFENYMSEKTKSHINEYKYDDIQKVLETGKYFFIFHNSESVSIVDKAHFSGDGESFSDFIKTKTQYKKIK